MDSQTTNSDDTFYFTGTELDLIISLALFPFSLAYTINMYKINDANWGPALAMTLLGGSVLLGGWVAMIVVGALQGSIGPGLAGIATGVASIFFVNLIVASALFGYSKFDPAYFGTVGNALIQDFFIGSAATFGVNLIGMIIFWILYGVNEEYGFFDKKNGTRLTGFSPYPLGVMISL